VYLLDSPVFSVVSQLTYENRKIWHRVLDKPFESVNSGIFLSSCDTATVALDGCLLDCMALPSMDCKPCVAINDRRQEKHHHLYEKTHHHLYVKKINVFARVLLFRKHGNQCVRVNNRLPV